MELVKFNDGKYGIRRGKPGKWEYYNFKPQSPSSDMWLAADRVAFVAQCRVSREEAELRMDAGTPTQRVIEPSRRLDWVSAVIAIAALLATIDGLIALLKGR